MKCFYIILVVSLIVDVLCLNSCIQLPAQQMQNPTMDNWQGNAAEQYLQDHITQNTGTPVDWWFIVKPAGWRNFIYYDSVMEATGAQAMVMTRSLLILLLTIKADFCFELLGSEQISSVAHPQCS